MQKINSQEELEKELVKHAKKLPGLIPKCTNEAQTKISLINPYLELLGWDVSNPDIVRQEYHASFKEKNPERVDYAILKGGKVLILIEAKSAETTLSPKAAYQIQKYFQTKKTNYGIMTNGVTWKWYKEDQDPAPDEKPGQLAKKPFLVHHANHAPSQEILLWLWHVHPDRFDEKALEHTAWQIDAQTQVRKWFERNRQEPDEDFVKFLIKKTRASKTATSSAVNNMKELVRNVLDPTNYSQDQARPESRGIQYSDTPPTLAATATPATVPKTPKPDLLENPYIPHWVPITEWKRFQIHGATGYRKPKVKITLRLPDRNDRECVGWSNLVRAVIDWMDSRFISAPIPEARLIYVPGSKRIFGSTEPRSKTGTKFKIPHSARNLEMHFELNKNIQDLMPSVISLLEKFQLDPQQVMIRSSKGTGEHHPRRN